MSNLGTRLKKAREARGVDLREIAAATKISVTALEALERNDFSRLPGGIFSRSFVRAYALSVGLDPDAAVDEFVTALHHREREKERAARKPEISADDREFLARQERAIRQLRIGAAVALMLVVAVVLWWVWRRDAAATDAPSPAGQPPVTAPAASSPADPAPPPALEPQAAAPVASAAAAVPPTADALALEFEFLAPCWMVIVADGALDARRQFEAGDQHAVRAKQEIVLNVGNAGGFRWTINGRQARPLGRSGATREVRITRTNYSAFVE